MNNPGFFFLLQHERKIRHAGMRMSFDASIKDAAEEVGLLDAMTSPFGLLYRNEIWHNLFASNYDKVSASLMDARQDFKGSPEVFPDGYKQIVSR